MAAKGKGKGKGEIDMYFVVLDRVVVENAAPEV